MVLVTPPSPFPAFNVKTLRAGHQLFRVHDPKFSGAQFNPCAGVPSRFSPLVRKDRSCLPALYAADTFESAIHESVFHDQTYAPGEKFITVDKITSRAQSILTVGKDIRLASLNQPDLMSLGLTLSDLIHTDATTYAETARWAEAFYEADRTISGLVWTSRRCDPAQAYMFFEDRIPANGLTVNSTKPFASSSDLVLEVRAFGKRAGITIIL